MDNQPYYDNKRSSGFATASMVLGVISLAGSCCLYLAIPCSALSIIFALLSRGGKMKLDNRGGTGLILGIMGLAAGIMLFFMMFFYMTVSMGGVREFLDYYTQYTEQYMQYLNY